MEPSDRNLTTYEVLQRHGVDRRNFLKFCTQTAAALGLSAAFVPKVVEAMETKPRIPVLWLHGLECTCCSESFIRSSHPIAQDIIMNMISLDYDDTLQAAAGFQVEEIRRDVMKKYKGQYLLAVEGNAPTADGGVYCTVGGETFQHILEETAADAKAIIAWGSCASNGCVQAAKPNPTGAKPSPQADHGQADHQRSGLPADRRSHDRRAGVHPDVRQAARTGLSGPAKNVFRPAAARQMLPARILRRRPVCRSLGRRRSAQGLVPVQNGVPWADDLQLLLDVQVELRAGLAGQLRPPVHRLCRGQFLGQRPVLSTLSNVVVPGIDSTPDQIGKTLLGRLRRWPGART